MTEADVSALIAQIKGMRLADASVANEMVEVIYSKSGTDE